MILASDSPFRTRASRASSSSRCRRADCRTLRRPERAAPGIPANGMPRCKELSIDLLGSRRSHSPPTAPIRSFSAGSDGRRTRSPCGTIAARSTTPSGTTIRRPEAGCGSPSRAIAPFTETGRIRLRRRRRLTTGFREGLRAESSRTGGKATRRPRRSGQLPSLRRSRPAVRPARSLSPRAVTRRRGASSRGCGRSRRYSARASSARIPRLPPEHRRRHVGVRQSACRPEGRRRGRRGSRRRDGR